MPENFFEPGKPSRCLFTPELRCDPYKHNSPMAPVDFLCDLAPRTVAVVIPAPTAAGDEPWGPIYETIAGVWKDRSIGFNCMRTDAEAFSIPRPCHSCDGVRSAHVVVIDAQGGDLRAASFRDMAISSGHVLNIFKATSGADAPNKLVIIINNGPLNLPPHVQKMFSCINYAGADGQPDLELLDTEMRRIARESELFTEGEQIYLDLAELEGGVSAVAPTTVAPTAPTDEEVEIRVLETIDSSVLNATPPGLEAAERLLTSGDAQAAIAMLLALPRAEIPGDRLRFGSLLSISLARISTPELGEILFPEQGWHGAVLQTTRLRLLGSEPPGEEILLAAVDHLTAEVVDRLHGQLTAEQAPPCVIVILTRQSDREAQRDLAIWQASCSGIRILELSIADLELVLGRQDNLHTALLRRLEPEYTRAKDCFLLGVNMVISHEDDFFGRDTFLQDRLRDIESGKSFAILGLPRFGKTSVLERLARLSVARGALALNLDMRLLWPRTASSLAHSLVRGLAQTLDDSYPADEYPRASHSALEIGKSALKPWLQSQAKDEIASLGRRIGDFLSRLRQDSALGFRQLVLCLDDFDRLLPHPSTGVERLVDSRRLLLELRDLLNEGGAAVVVTGFGPTIPRELGNDESPLHGRMGITYLPHLERKESELLLRVLGHRMSAYFSDSAISLIHDSCGGDPRLMRYLASTVLESHGRTNTPDRVVDRDAVEKGCETFLTSSATTSRLGQAFEPFAAAYPVAADLAIRIAAHSDDPGPWVEIFRLADRGHSHDLERELEPLRSYGLVEYQHPRRLRLHSRLMHRWLRLERAS